MDSASAWPYTFATIFQNAGSGSAPKSAQFLVRNHDEVVRRAFVAALHRDHAVVIRPLGLVCGGRPLLQYRSEGLVGGCPECRVKYSTCTSGGRILSLPQFAGTWLISG